MALVLDVVAESLVRGEHVASEYGRAPGFDPSWWHGSSAKSPVSWCRLRDGGVEVARAKVLHRSRSYSGYDTWTPPPAGATEIDLIEVREDLRRSSKNYGREAV